MAWGLWELLRRKLGHELDVDRLQEEFPGLPDELVTILREVTAPVPPLPMPPATPAPAPAPAPSYEVDSVDDYSYLPRAMTRG